MALLFSPGYQFLDSNGDPVTSGELSVYDNLTTNAASIYADPAFAVALPNPLPLDAAGRLTTNVYAADNTRFTITLRANTALVWSRDNSWGSIEEAGTTTAITYTNAASGADSRTLQKRLDDRVSLTDFYDVDSPPSSFSSTFIDALNAIQITGKTLFVPSGTYAISTVINPTITGDINIEFEGGAEVVADAGLSDRMFFFNAGAGGTDTKIKWKGGRLNGSAQPNQGTGTAWDNIYLGEDIHDFYIDGCEIYNGTDPASSGSDSGIFAVARNVRITNCRFTGVWDAAIYLSGDTSGTNGESAYISGCYFEKCQVGVNPKRIFRRCKVVGNDFVKCVVAVAFSEAGTTAAERPGTENIIMGNSIAQCGTGIQVRKSDFTVVQGNVIEDFAYNYDDTVLSGFGIRIEGSSYCSIIGNIICTRGQVRSTAGTVVAINLADSTGLDSTFSSTYNMIAMNTIEDTAIAMREETNADHNQFMFNLTEDVTTRSTIVGAGTVLVHRNSDTESRLGFECLLSLGGAFNRESLRVSEPITPGTQGTFVNIQGEDSGSAPVIAAASNVDSNVDLQLQPKGTGVIEFGYAGSSAGTPGNFSAANYMTMNLGGTTIYIPYQTTTW